MLYNAWASFESVESLAGHLDRPRCSLRPRIYRRNGLTKMYHDVANEVPIYLQMAIPHNSFAAMGIETHIPLWSKQASALFYTSTCHRGCDSGWRHGGQLYDSR
jgi:hypothetical protein